MSARPVRIGTTGFYGKLPARGDFIRRRLDDDFVMRWDDFLARGLQAAESSLGHDFTSLYQVSPFWRFALAAGVAGQQAMIGVLLPSADRAGRLFPLTIAAPLASPCTPREAVAGAAGWFEMVEDAALDHLSRDADLDHFDQIIAALSLPPDSGQQPLETRSDAPALWWTTGSPDIAAQCHGTPALPPAETFRHFLDGHWEAIE